MALTLLVLAPAAAFVSTARPVALSVRRCESVVNRMHLTQGQPNVFEAYSWSALTPKVLKQSLSALAAAMLISLPQAPAAFALPAPMAVSQTVAATSSAAAGVTGSSALCSLAVAVGQKADYHVGVLPFRRRSRLG